MVHNPLVHPAEAFANEHACWHDPQCLGSVARSTSQPSVLDPLQSPRSCEQPLLEPPAAPLPVWLLLVGTPSLASPPAPAAPSSDRNSLPQARTEANETSSHRRRINIAIRSTRTKRVVDAPIKKEYHPAQR